MHEPSEFPDLEGSAVAANVTLLSSKVAIEYLFKSMKTEFMLILFGDICQRISYTFPGHLLDSGFPSKLFYFLNSKATLQLTLTYCLGNKHLH